MNIMLYFPQGRNIAPLLFLLFIYNITHVRSSNKLFYATDLEGFFRMGESCTVNRVFLNISKCAVASFSLKQPLLEYLYYIFITELSRFGSIKDLVVIFHCKLTLYCYFKSFSDALVSL